MEHTPGREAPEVCCSGDVPLGMCSVHLFQPLGESHVTLIGIDLGPTSTMGMPAHDPGVSPMLFSPGHQNRSPELRASVPGAVVLLRQLRLWPSPAPSLRAHNVYSC